MKVDLGIWNKLTQVVILLMIVAGVIGVGVWYMPLISQNERLRKQIMRLEAQEQQEAAIKKRLTGSIDALQHDQKTIERLARERLGYAKTGETVIRFEGPLTNSTSQQ